MLPPLRPFALDPRYQTMTPSAYVQGAAVGYTAPAATFDRMRQMQDASAAPLNRDVTNHVADPVFRAAWNRWYQQAWIPFFSKYAGPDAGLTTRLATNLYSDQIAMQAESFRRQLADFYASYARQRTPAGAPVPPASGAEPYLEGPTPASGSVGLKVLAAAAGFAVVAGAGYLAYQYLIRPAVEDALPKVTQAIGAAAGSAGSGGRGGAGAAQRPLRDRDASRAPKARMR